MPTRQFPIRMSGAMQRFGYELLRTPYTRSSQNPYSTHSGE